MNPSSTEVKITLFITSTIGASVYSSYVKSFRLSGSERVLDVGSGSGAIARHIAPLLARGGGLLTCLDLSPVWLGVARNRLRRYTNIDYVLADVSEAPLPESSYDAAVIHFVLHEIPQSRRAKAAQALARILKPGGRIYIREPLSEHDGMPAQEIEAVLSSAGFTKISGQIGKLPMAGPVFTAIYVNQGRN